MHQGSATNQRKRKRRVALPERSTWTRLAFPWYQQGVNCMGTDGAVERGRHKARKSTIHLAERQTEKTLHGPNGEVLSTDPRFLISFTRPKGPRAPQTATTQPLDVSFGRLFKAALHRTAVGTLAADREPSLGSWIHHRVSGFHVPADQRDEMLAEAIARHAIWLQSGRTVGGKGRLHGSQRTRKKMATMASWKIRLR